MHDFYRKNNVKQLQKECFRKATLPKVAISPFDANLCLVKGHVDYIRIDQAKGRIAVEGALPYPPGILCVVPGEIWDGAAQKYFISLEAGINLFPGFAPELQGVYIETDKTGHKHAYCHVIKN